MLILALSLVLRLVAINQSFWLDEAIGALAVRDFSYEGILANFLLSDNHPPLYYLFLKFWTNIFGYSEISIRTPSLLFGVATVWIAFLIGKKIIKGKTFPVIAALFIATSPFHIYYSQEARMYAMAGFWAALTVHAFLKTFDSKASKTVWIVFSFAITALVFTDYVPVFLLPVFWIMGFCRRTSRNWWRLFALSHMPILVLGFLWLPTFNIQRQKGAWLLATLPSWRRVAGGANFKQLALVWMKFTLGRVSLQPKKLYYGLIGIFSIPFGLAFFLAFRYLLGFRKKVFQSKSFLIFLWFFVPLFLGLLASFLFPAFIYFRFLYIVPAFYLLLALGISKISKPVIRKLSILLVIMANFVGLTSYYFDHKQQRENWRSAVQLVDSKIKNDEVVLFSYPNPFSPYRWYSKKLDQAYGATNSISADTKKSQEITKSLLKNKNGVYYFDYLSDLSDPSNIVLETIEKSDFETETIYSYYNIGFIRYYKKRTK